MIDLPTIMIGVALILFLFITFKDCGDKRLLKKYEQDKVKHDEIDSLYEAAKVKLRATIAIDSIDKLIEQDKDITTVRKKLEADQEVKQLKDKKEIHDKINSNHISDNRRFIDSIISAN